MEKERRISIEAFEALLPDVCDRETSQDGARWSAKNPLWGHCAIVSVAAQELFGGELRRASFAGNPGFGENASYYWNALADGSEHDFTRAQFGAQYPRLRDPVPRTRAYVLFGPAGAGTALRENFKRTRQRYALLKWRIEKRLAGENPLFNDPMFEQCFLAACDSQCQKMRVGCAVECDGKLIAATSNRFIEPLRHLCDPECVRLKIPSRTDAVIGACGHAEEWALNYVQECDLNPIRTTLYVACFSAENGRPLWKNEREFTCLLCAREMALRAPGISVAVPVSDHWEFLSAEEAVRTAEPYALGEKRI